MVNNSTIMIMESRVKQRHDIIEELFYYNIRLWIIEHVLAIIEGTFYSNDSTSC